MEHAPSSYPRVKPVLTFRSQICFTVTLMAFFAVNVSAADPSHRQSSRRNHSGQARNVRSSERVARASWQPARRNQKRSDRQSAESFQGTSSQGTSTVKLVDHGEVRQAAAQNIPLPPTDSIIEQPIRTPLDGQIALAPIGGSPLGGLPSYDGGVLFAGSDCDGLPPGQCGCDGMGCDGGCDGGCDSMSCDGGCDGGCSTCGELCSTEAWRPCVTVCIPQDGWINFEYLMWWQDGMELPPLVTTSVGTGIPATQAGVLGLAPTRTLFGGNDVLTDNFDGGRLRFGVWLDKCHTWGIGAEYFKIGSESEGFSQTSTGNPILARPFFNMETNREDSELVAFPGILTGNVTAQATSQLTGTSIYLRYLRQCDEGCNNGLFCGCPSHYCSRTEMMFGYRGLELKENVFISEDLNSTDQGNPGTFDILDRFETRNQFNGIDLGWMYRRTRGFWSLDTQLRLAVGNTKQTVRINGHTTITDPSTNPPTQTYPGGLLTQTPGNIGVYTQNEFSVVPEFGATLGYQLTDHLRATVGYTFIYWSNVVRPGDQISRDVNPNLLQPQVPPITGAIRPGFEFDTTDYWVQGISFGGEYRW